MPTASGNPESALYGSTRTGQYGQRVMSRFHEGIDIAPLARDRNGRPLDDVYAAADGRVALVQRVAGNSDYGLYVVLIHDDPVGEFYTLYAHLASIRPDLQAGRAVRAGEVIGRMGNTALTPIPMPRAHLHFEIGLVANTNFLSWPGRPKKDAPGGLYNGLNLWGIDPLRLYRHFEQRGAELTLLDHLRELPPAFELVVRTPRLPDYFRRYPALWDGPMEYAGPIVLAVQEGGVILGGRPASLEEQALLGSSASVVLRVDEGVLARNGRRLVVRENGRWRIGASGESWLSLLLH